MVNRKRHNRRGNTMLEFVLVGIPMIFIFISIVEIARGMWTYHTLAYAVREGVRYASVHGSGCASPNTCQVTIGNIANVIQSAGVGLDPNTVSLTFTTAGGTATTDTMTNQKASTTTWPPSGSNAAGQNVKISAKYPFRTFLSVFWAGSGRPLNDSGVFYLPASSTEPIQF
jgi:Flp pilus assembly protein TadG